MATPPRSYGCTQPIGLGRIQVRGIDVFFSPSMSTGRRAAISFVFITLVLDVLALGVIIPVLPRLVAEFVGGSQAEAVRIGGYLSLVWAAMQFIFTPIQGALSDRFGRRPVLLLSMTGLGLDYVLTALSPNLKWLFVARAISGVTAASFSTASAYIADITPPEKRAGAFGLMGAAFGIGFVLGPALGGWAGHIDPRLPFWVAAALSLVNAIYGYFILPESLPEDRRSAFSLKRANPVGALQMLIGNAQLAPLALGQLFYYVAHGVYPAVFVWFTMYRYGWDVAKTGLALAASGLAGAVVQAGLVGRVVRRIGERRAMLLGLAFGMSGFIVYGYGPTDTSIWIAIVLSALWGFYNPSVQSLMSQRVAPTEQGRLQGALGSIAGIASLISPPLYTHVFATAIDQHKMLGAPFYVAAALLGVALLTALRAVFGPQPVIAPPTP
jgi:DHA1 family tetracycline resistance protein-like MFS transporter